MTSIFTLRYGLILLLAVTLLLTAGTTTASNSRPPRNNDISNMADALKYLQDLDTYYGDRARVRFGKRTSLAQLLRNRIADNTEMARPVDFPAAADEPF